MMLGNGSENVSKKVQLKKWGRRDEFCQGHENKEVLIYLVLPSETKGKANCHV